MPAHDSTTKRALDPIDRISEVLFGLIMVLTFTGSLSVADVGRDDVVMMLVGALGCNLAWGIIDGVFYLMGCLAERGHNLALHEAIHRAGESSEADRLLASALPPVVAALVEPAEIAALRTRLLATPAPDGVASLSAGDFRGALAVFLLVFLSTFPVTLPFVFLSDAPLALRISNGIAVALLFITGYAFGKVTGRPPLAVGVAMVVMGLILVGITIALGG